MTVRGGLLREVILVGTGLSDAKGAITTHMVNQVVGGVVAEYVLI